MFCVCVKVHVQAKNCSTRGAMSCGAGSVGLWLWSQNERGSMVCRRALIGKVDWETVWNSWRASLLLSEREKTRRVINTSGAFY